ncbi:unnamed protein product [Mytilus coruscus]|uniref:WSC domain-containing protein n=1 Tax=Mytilus coruscus TaxID=42192 RepID=A0A6J8EJ19_MYTCO|nr:unnamed protein product [Mytilus coruscus]
MFSKKKSCITRLQIQNETFGKEYTDCFCGNNPFRNRTEDDDYYLQSSDCYLPCYGDLTQICGGYRHISVYKTGFLPLNSGNTFYKEFAKDYKLTTQTRRAVRMRNVSHCAMHCLFSISCRAFEVCMETAECSLIFDYETLCDGIQHAVGYVIYMMQ